MRNSLYLCIIDNGFDIMAEADNTIKYEDAMKQLEELVAKMENGDIGIDALSENLKKAQELIGLCKDKLMKTEEEIKQLQVTSY